MFGKNDVNSKCIKTNSAERYFKQNEKSTGEADKNDTNGQKRLKISSQIFGSERKSSDIYCDIDDRSDNSGILVIDTDYREEGNFKEISLSILKENHEIAHKKRPVDLQTTSQGYNKDINLTEEVKRPKSFKFDQDLKVTESVIKCLADKTLQPNKIETNLSVKDSQTINSNESLKFSQNNSKFISSEGSCCFQKNIKKADASTKLSQVIINLFLNKLLFYDLLLFSLFLSSNDVAALSLANKLYCKELNVAACQFINEHC